MTLLELNSILNKIYKPILMNKKTNISDTILITGSPRSGTTWIMELFEKIPTYRPIFEPINPNWYPDVFQKGFTSRPYLPPDKEWLQGKEYLKKIFEGKVFPSAGPMYQANPRLFFSSFFTDKILIKEVRINRLLPWIVKNFKLKEIILIIRHPCAVINSQLKTNYTAYYSPQSPLKDIIPNCNDIVQEAISIETLDQNLINKLKNLQTTEERLAATWCLDTFIPLYIKNPKHWKTIIYEKCFTQNEEEITNSLNLISNNDYRYSIQSQINRPSKTTRRSEFKLLQSRQQLEKWKKSLTDHQIKRILDLVSAFGLDFYTEDPEPDYDRLYNEKIII